MRYCITLLYTINVYQVGKSYCCLCWLLSITPNGLHHVPLSYYGTVLYPTILFAETIKRIPAERNNGSTTRTNYRYKYQRCRYDYLLLRSLNPAPLARKKLLALFAVFLLFSASVPPPPPSPGCSSLPPHSMHEPSQRQIGPRRECPSIVDRTLTLFGF